MRERKFRAWEKPTQQMFGWNYVKHRSGFQLACDGDNSIWELMQYIGLKDKNGVEIYEGDIIRVLNVTYQIIFKGIGFWFMDIDTGELYVFDPQVYDIEIIGNLYENPELLNETHHGTPK